MTPEPEDTDPDGALPALTSARVVIYRTDLTSGSIRRSANSRDVLNLPRDGMLDAFRSAIFPEDLAQFDDTIAGVARHAPNYEIEYRIAASPAGAMDHIWVLDRGSGEFDDDGKLVALKGAIVDVSARASIERELRQAARLRQVVFEAARMAAWHLDMASGRFTCTDEILELLEVRREDFGGTTEAVEHAIHPDDREAWHRAHQRARSPGSRVEIEFRVQLKNGAERWLLSRGEVVRSRDGMPFESYGVMIDITARKKSEEDAARLASIVASSEDAILSKSLRGQVTSWNKAAERMFGFTAEEMIGESVWRLIPEDGEHEELNILNTIRLGNTISPYDSVRLHKSGRRIHVSISVSPIRNAKGDVVGASTIARDITEQRRQGEILRENEARLRLALRSARAGAWNFDLVRRELHWSPEMYDIYGLDPANGLPNREDLIERIAPPHRARAQAEFARALLRGGSFTLEFPIIRQDGSESWTSLAGDVIKNDGGKPVGARGIDQDITERKAWEKRQAMLLRELSHRVKNTLAVIQSVARQTLRSSPTPRAFVDAFEGRIRSLAASHSLLTEVDWKGADLHTVIRNQVAGVVENLDSRFTFRGPEVVLSAEVATQLGLVIHELATNAVKHGALSAPEGHVDVVWTAPAGKLRLAWRERGGPPADQKPGHSGFGTLLINSSALKVQRHFSAEGLHCKLELAR